MSKIGSKPIPIPEGVTVEQKDGGLTVKGKLGEQTVKILPFVSAVVEGKEIKLTIIESHKQARSNWGTMGALVKNSIVGVSTGFQKSLDVQGIGFKAALEGKNLTLSLGFSHPVKFAPPAGVTLAVAKSIITVSGVDRYLVGQAAAQIRKLKKPEPYQGKGIRYVGEAVRRKAGKKVAGTGTTA